MTRRYPGATSSSIGRWKAPTLSAASTSCTHFAMRAARQGTQTKHPPDAGCVPWSRSFISSGDMPLVEAYTHESHASQHTMPMLLVPYVYSDRGQLCPEASLGRHRWHALMDRGVDAVAGCILRTPAGTDMGWRKLPPATACRAIGSAFAAAAAATYGAVETESNGAAPRTATKPLCQIPGDSGEAGPS